MIDSRVRSRCAIHDVLAYTCSSLLVKKFRWNQGDSFACYTLLSLTGIHMTHHRTHCVCEVWRHPHNRMYIFYFFYCIATPLPRAICRKIWWSSIVWFLRYTSGQTDKQTNKHTQHTMHPPGGENSKWTLHRATVSHICMYSHDTAVIEYTLSRRKW